MKIITGFTYYNGIQSVSDQSRSVLSNGTNSFSFPLNVQDDGEEPFIIGGKYGPHFVASGDVSEVMIDWKVIETVDNSINGGFVVTNSAKTESITIYPSCKEEFTCAALNNLAWKAAQKKWGANAITKWSTLTKIYLDGYEGQLNLRPYYRGTEDVITEIGDTLVYTYCSQVTHDGPLYCKHPITITAIESPMTITSSLVTGTNNSDAKYF